MSINTPPPPSNWHPLPIEVGGTGGTTPTVARQKLGLQIPSGGASNVTFLQSGTGAVARTVQDKERDVVSVKDFGAKGDGVTDDTAAITAANAAAVAAGKALYWPQTGSKYIYKPSATLNLQIDWYSDNMPQLNMTTIEVDSSLFSGPYFKMITGCELRNLYLQEKSSAKVGTCLLIKHTDPADWVSFAILTKCIITGFDKNVECWQSLWLRFESTQLSGGNEGFYHVPTGYSNAHTHINPLYYNNARNVKYASTVVSKDITFIGGSLDLATGAAEQASFDNVTGLTLISPYFEGASTIPALRLNSVTANIINLWLGSTGGVALGTNAKVIFNGVDTASATDVCAGGNGTQEITMIRCNWPSSGSGISYSIFNAIDTSINGVLYGNLAKEFVSIVGARYQRQVNVVSGAGATDVYRFFDITGLTAIVSGVTTIGTFYLKAIDNANGANQAVYSYRLETLSAALTGAVLTQISRAVRATDVGVSATPFTIAADGAGSVKLQFQKNAAIANVTVHAMYVGLDI